MIVKDEAHVIKRCLDSVKLLVDHVLVIDTGSSDNTKSEINKWLLENSMTGTILDNIWVDFSYNRTNALLEIAKIDWIDYALMIDADEILVYDKDFDPDAFKSSLDKDFYDVVSNMNGIIYTRPTLTSNKTGFRYEGVVHEFLALDKPYTRGHASGFYNSPIQDSNRNKSNKFIQDISLLEKALSDDNLNDFMKSRYRFYLAQSYKDSGNLKKAVENYTIRSTMGFWREEEFISLYSVAKLELEMGRPPQEVLSLFLIAWNHSPHRLEALHEALKLCRLNGWSVLGYPLGKYALDNLQYPTESLFLESWIYDYGIIDEFSSIAFYSGHYDECEKCCNRLLEEKKIPDFYYDRVKSNLHYCLNR